MKSKQFKFKTQAINKQNSISRHRETVQKKKSTSPVDVFIDCLQKITQLATLGCEVQQKTDVARQEQLVQPQSIQIHKSSVKFGELNVRTLIQVKNIKDKIKQKRSLKLLASNVAIKEPSNRKKSLVSLCSPLQRKMVQQDQQIEKLRQQLQQDNKKKGPAIVFQFQFVSQYKTILQNSKHFAMAVTSKRHQQVQAREKQPPVKFKIVDEAEVGQRPKAIHQHIKLRHNDESSENQQFRLYLMPPRTKSNFASKIVPSEGVVVEQVLGRNRAISLPPVSKN